MIGSTGKPGSPGLYQGLNGHTLEHEDRAGDDRESEEFIEI